MSEEVEMTTCPDCEGTGIIQCPACEQDVDCPECDGSGEVEE